MQHLHYVSVKRKKRNSMWMNALLYNIVLVVRVALFMSQKPMPHFPGSFMCGKAWFLQRGYI